MKAFRKGSKDFNLFRRFIFLIKPVTKATQKKILAPMSDLIKLLVAMYPEREKEREKKDFEQKKVGGNGGILS